MTTKVNLNNSLAHTHPIIAAKWHPTKNGDFTPYMITKGSSKNFWFQCPKNKKHVFLTCPVSLNNKTAGCCYCTGRKFLPEDSFGGKYPELAELWDYKKNKGKRPENFSHGSREKMWWLCPKQHSFQSEIRNIVKSKVETNSETTCNECKLFINRATPELIARWDFDKNKHIDINTAKVDLTVVHWKCTVCGYEYPASIISKFYGKKGEKEKCMSCPKRKLTPENSFVNNSPKFILDEVDPDNIIDVSKETINSRKKCKWICLENPKHKWITTIYNRMKSMSGCPECRTLNKSSSGEQAVSKILNRLGVEWEKEIKITGCENERPLRFDFGVFLHSTINTPDDMLLIEFDGDQHFNYTSLFGDIGRFKRGQENDKIKNKFCKDNDIRLLRLKNKDDIEGMIREFLDL